MKKFSVKFVVCMFLLIILALASLTISLSIKDMHPFLGNIFDDTASALFITGLFGLFNEFILKRDQLDMIIDKVNLKKSIDNAGIEDIVLGWQGIPYNKLFSETKKNIDVVNAYGQTWLKYYREKLLKVLKETNTNIRVILLDPNDDINMEAFSRHYNISKDELINRIKNVTNMCKSIYNEAGVIDENRLKIYYHKGIQTLALYRFDKYIVSNELEITKDFSSGAEFPNIICKDSNDKYTLYKIYLNQINDLIKESIQVQLSDI